jgi:hypothetical protein
MAAAAPADGSPGMSHRLFLVRGQQGRGDRGAAVAAKSGSCESYPGTSDADEQAAIDSGLIQPNRIQYAGQRRSHPPVPPAGV